MTPAKLLSILCFAVTTLLLTAGSERTEAAAEHNSWKRTYRNPAVWEWLLQQRCGSITPPPSEGQAEEKSARQDQR